MAARKNIQAAKASLHKQLKGKSWLRGIGIGPNTIELRVAPGYKGYAPKVWEGYRVNTVVVSAYSMRNPGTESVSSEARRGPSFSQQASRAGKQFLQAFGLGGGARLKEIHPPPTQARAR